MKRGEGEEGIDGVALRLRCCVDEINNTLCPCIPFRRALWICGLSSLCQLIQLIERSAVLCSTVRLPGDSPANYGVAKRTFFYPERCGVEFFAKHTERAVID